MLREAASRVKPLALRLRGSRYFQEGTHLKRGGGEVSVNDTTPERTIFHQLSISSDLLDWTI